MVNQSELSSENRTTLGMSKEFNIEDWLQKYLKDWKSQREKYYAGIHRLFLPLIRELDIGITLFTLL